MLGLLLAVGLCQMAGDLGGVTAVKAIGAALHASPAPKVFTAQQGFETYSAEFHLDWRDRQGRARTLQVTPAVYYRGVKGPYNRRNAYGAAISYAPVLDANPATRPMFRSVARHALCGDAPMLRELGIDRAGIAGPVTVRILPRQSLPADHSWRLRYDIAC